MNLGKLPDAYQPLLTRAQDVMEADARVRAAWVHGSVARDEADEVSDLDVIIAVDDDAIAEFGAGWRQRLASITPTVMARGTFGGLGSWLSITPDCLRFDLWMEPASNVSRSVVRDRKLLFDRDGLAGQVPAPNPPESRSEERLDFWRGWAADCLALAQGADGLFAVECTHTLRWALYETMVEQNKPLTFKSLKRWSDKLTPGQRAQFEALPTDRWEPIAQVLNVEPSSNTDNALALTPPEGSVRGILDFLNLPPAERLRHIAEEFFALHLYLTVVVHRKDWLLGVEGVHTLRRLLYELALEENGRPEGNWDDRISPEARDEMLALPTGVATRDGVIAGHLAVREAFVRRGRRVLGDQWPTELEAAVTKAVA